MWLPILDHKVVGTPSTKQANLVGYGFFLIKNVSNGNANNYHIAQLVRDVVVQGRGTRDWDPSKTYNALVVRLTEQRSSVPTQLWRLRRTPTPVPSHHG